jgi:preprotein translocase subunit SecG
MYTFVLSIHIILAVVLVSLVLLQQGKGADVGAVMGGGANSLFGVGGASSLLVRMTTLIAICFMLTSVVLVRFSAIGSSVVGSRVDITEGVDLEALGVKPAAPQAPAAAQAPAKQEAAAAAPTGVAADSAVAPQQ